METTLSANKWKVAPLIIIFAVLPAQAAPPLPSSTQDVAKNVEFDSSFLNVGEGDAIDLSRFANGASVFPGIYRTDIYINDQIIGNYNLEIKSVGSNTTTPCISKEILKNIALNYEKLPSDFLSKEDKNCPDLQRALKGSVVFYDSNEQRLNITIPQIYMLRTARGSVSPEMWDSGVPALLLGYNTNFYSSESRGTDYKSFYANLAAGLNLGAWYLRHNGNYNWVKDGKKKYSTTNTYLQRDIPAVGGRALIGQSNTQGSLFDTIPFTGVQLASDERMLPDSLRGYAPQIRGIARSNARVTIRQNEQIIYETTVTPGEFLINDLYPTGYGGNLDVTVREADGSEQKFQVPYAAVTQLLRPGNNRYSMTAGRLRSNSLRDAPALYQATWQRGLTNSLTGYGGVQASQNYYAVQLGAALGAQAGAFALDVTQARTHLGSSGGHAENAMSGQSYQLSYSKTVSATSSNISLAAYRFSTSGYMDLITAMQTREAVEDGLSTESIWRAKNRFIVTASQGLPDNWGQIYLSSSLQNYWNQGGNSKQYQLGYSTNYKTLTWGFSVNRTYSLYGQTQNNYLLNCSLPLGNSGTTHLPQLRVDLSHNTSGRYAEQVTLSGNAGEENQYGYDISATNANQGSGTSGSVNGSWRSSVAGLNANYSQGDNYRSTAAGISGSLIGHTGGITLTPYTSDTFALVEAKGAYGAKVSSYPGVYIDRAGYAVVPYLNPYKLNEIVLDPRGIPADIELDNTSQKVAPYAGAVVKLSYATRQGTALLINATYNSVPIAFGAEVTDSKGNHVGTVGQGGQIYARVQDERGKLHVKWGSGPGMQCSVNYILMPQDKDAKYNALQRFDSVCQHVSESSDPVKQLASFSAPDSDVNS